MKQRIYRIDGDQITVTFRLDEPSGLYLGDYPSFDDEPRYTPSGRPWRNVISEGCPHAAGEYDDCGDCPHLMRQQPGDLIGVCFNDHLLRHTERKESCT